MKMKISPRSLEDILDAIDIKAFFNAHAASCADLIMLKDSLKKTKCKDILIVDI